MHVVHRLATLVQWWVTVSLSLSLLSCADDPAARVSISGHAFSFYTGHPPIPGAVVRVVERPELEVVTGEDGAFRIDDLEEGTDATLVMLHDQFVETQTKTFHLGADDLERVTFQAPDVIVFAFMSTKLDTAAEPDRCQIASTVTEVGLSMYDDVAHGVAGATVTIDPEVPAEAGPYYFDAATIPDLDLGETSDDGGVIYVNVLPGRYQLRAHKPGVEFESVDVWCRPGVLVNAAPPQGLQAL